MRLNTQVNCNRQKNVQFYFTFIDYYDFVDDMTIQIVEFLYVCLLLKWMRKNGKVALCISISLSGDSDLILCLKILYIYFYLRLFGFFHNVSISIWHANNIL